MRQPQSASADVGDAVTQSVAASGGAPLAFQWRKNGAVISNATMSSLVLTNVTTNDVANYTVVVSDPSGSMNSQIAALTVAGISPAAPTGGFDGWVLSSGLPANASGPANDPDGDGVPNIFEYYFGSNPVSAASAAEPAGTSVRVGTDNFPAVTFVRAKSATGVTAQVLVSSKVNFSDSLGAAQETVTDLSNGTERVTVRSSVNDRTQPIQFLKVRLSLSP